jgi:putative nucleotidyltransferase-like protein
MGVRGAGFWPAIAAGRSLAMDEARRLRPAVSRLAAFTSAALADWLLSGSADPAGALIAPADIERDRLLARFTRTQGLRWFGVLAEAGIDVVCLKGMAAGSFLYPQADLRAMSDVDLLVRARDLKKLVEMLAAQGFAFAKARGTPRWGHIGDASFHPFVAPNGAFSLDLHVQPDDDPLHRGLPVDDVFAASRFVTVDGAQIRIPSGPHLLLLALTNAARDKLGAEALKSIVDAVVYLARTDLEPGWPEILQRARAGGFLRTVKALVAFLAALGVPGQRLPQDLGDPGALARGELGRVVADVADCYPALPGKLALQRREILLLAPFPVVVRRYGRRLRGLAAPWPGMPAL